MDPQNKIIEEYVYTLLAFLLGLQSTSQLDINVKLIDLGLDDQEIYELRMRVQKEFKINIDKRNFEKLKQRTPRSWVDAIRSLLVLKEMVQARRAQKKK